jgi:hypothetical protein
MRIVVWNCKMALSRKRTTVGDDIGLVYERKNTKIKQFDLFSLDCCFTDDTVLTVALAESILTGPGYPSLATACYRSYPDAGFCPLCSCKAGILRTEEFLFAFVFSHPVNRRPRPDPYRRRRGGPPQGLPGHQRQRLRCCRKKINSLWTSA